MKSRWIVVLVAVLGIGGNVKAGNIGAYSLQTGVWTFKEYEFRDTAAYNLLAKYVSREYFFDGNDQRKNFDGKNVTIELPGICDLRFLKRDHVYLIAIYGRFRSSDSDLENCMGVIKVGSYTFFIQSDNDSPENIRQFLQQNFRDTGKMCLYYVPARPKDVSFASFCGPSSWQFVVGTDWKWHLLFCPRDSVREGITNNG